MPYEVYSLMSLKIFVKYLKLLTECVHSELVASFPENAAILFDG